MSEGGPARYVYPLTSPGGYKETRRTGTPYGLPHDMVGFDGGVAGPPKPHYGFRWVHDLTGVQADGRNALQVLLQAFPVNFRVGATSSAWGFVYVVWDSETSGAKVFLEYRLGVSTTWLGPVELKSLVLAEGDKRTMSVVPQGIKVYVFIEGTEPLLFYYDEDTSAIVVRTDTGPGEAPTLDMDTGVIVTNAGVVPVVGLVDEEGLASRAVDVLYEFDEPTNGAPGRGRVHFVAFGKYNGISPPDLSGPSDLSLWTVTPEGQEDPVFDDVQGGTGQHWISGLGAMGGASLRTGRPTSYYKFAFQLYDSTTGRKSNLSELSSGAIGSFYPVFNAQGEYVLFGLLELVYDSSKFDQCYVYRTVRGEGESNATLNLDNIIELEDFHATNQSGLSGDWRRVFYFYELHDPVLAAQPVFIGFNVFDAEMPTAGAAMLYDGAMLFGDTQALDTETGGLGVVRWSTPYEISPELVSPSARYYLVRPDEEVIRFLRVGPNVCGYSLTGIYHGRKETTFLKWTPIHEEFGGPSYRGSETIGSSSHVVTESGVKTVGPMGSIDEVFILDKVVQEDWAGEVHQVEMAYDGATEALYILNPAQEHAVVLWQKTGAMTELYDMNFEHCAKGVVPQDPHTSNTPLKSRACFFQKVSPEGLDENPVWRVWVPDRMKENVGRRMLGHTCESAVFDTAAKVTFVSGGPTYVLGPSGTFDGDRLEGCKLYVMAVEGDDDSAYHGRSATILRKVDDTLVQLVNDGDAQALHNLPAGSTMGISPVFVKVTCWAVGMIQASADDPVLPPFDYTRLRHVHSVGCTFSAVSGDSSFVDGRARFAAMVYKGDNETWENFGTWSFPKTPRGEVHTSVADGPSQFHAMLGVGNQGVQGSALFPSIEIFTPDIDYTLLNVVVYGSVKAEDTEHLAIIT